MGDGNLIVAFGPYLAYALGGKIKFDGGDDEDVEFGSKEGEWKRFDMGANLGFGYQLGGGLSFMLNTQLGLANLEAKGDSDNSVKNIGFGLSLGYRF